MKTIKENSYDIVRLIVNQVGISIFALVLYTSMGFVGESSDELAAGLRIVFSIFSIIFYWVLLYMMMWESGAKDKVGIESGKLDEVKGKGALLALVANIPNFLVAFFAVVSNLLYNFTGVEIFNTVFFIFNLIMRFIAAMYIGVAGAVVEPFGFDVSLSFLLQSVFYLFVPLLTVGVCQVGYNLGMKNFKIFSRQTKN